MRQRAIRIAAGAAASGALLVAFLLWWGEGAERAPPGRAAPPGEAQQGPAVSTSSARDVASAPTSAELGSDVTAHLANMPKSLRGTDVDGGLNFDADGHFLPDTDALSLFNYFLAASGEESQARIRQRIVDHIHSLLGEPAASEAVALLDTYLDFRDAMRELAEAGWVPRDLERRWQWIRELRRQHFGAATSAMLFGQEEEVVLIDLERRRVAADESLSPEERAEELNALEMRLPESVRESRQRARAPMLARDEVVDLRAAGGSEEEVFAVRELYFGREAAERLSALDAKQREWRARLESYRSERDALLSEIEGEEPEKQHAAIEDLRRQHFSELEVLRVRALDEM
jgi:lipase chaperone LimK